MPHPGFFQDERLRHLARRLPGGLTSVLKRALVRPPLKVRWGSLRRVTPFSDVYGADRGTPVDRFYIEQFLGSHSSQIRGEVLEVRDPEYTQLFGGPEVTGSHILDVDAENPTATIVADLSEKGSLPAAAFDCFILTQTLQYVADVAIAVQNAWEALSPGGALMVSVPALSRIDWTSKVADLWRFTPAGLARIIRTALPPCEVDVKGYGNVVTATAFLMGLAAEELGRVELRVSDPDFPVVACALVRKARNEGDHHLAP